MAVRHPHTWVDCRLLTSLHPRRQFLEKKKKHREGGPYRVTQTDMGVFEHTSNPHRGTTGIKGHAFEPVPMGFLFFFFLEKRSL